MWTLAKQAKLQSFRKKPSYILLYIVVCKICSVCCISFRYNFIAKSYPMLDVLLMNNLDCHLRCPLPLHTLASSHVIQSNRLLMAASLSCLPLPLRQYTLLRHRWIGLAMHGGALGIFALQTEHRIGLDWIVHM